MFRFIGNLFGALPSVLAGIFIIVMIWLFLVFPRVVNVLADLLGNMGTPLIAREQLIHTVIALLASLVPLYFLIIRPLRQVRDLSEGQGLSVRQGQGVAYIDTESARHQIYKAVNTVGGIKHTEVSVDSREGRAVVLLNLTTENSINAGRKKQEVRREIKKVLEDQLGVRLAGEPTINFRLAEVYTDIPRPTEPAAEPPRARALPPTPPPAAPIYTPPLTNGAAVNPPPPASSTSPIVGRRAMATAPAPEPEPEPIIVPPAPPVTPAVETEPVDIVTSAVDSAVGSLNDDVLGAESPAESTWSEKPVDENNTSEY